MKITKDLYDELTNLRIAYLNELGQEVNNPEPLFVNVTPRALSISEQIQRLLSSHLSRQAAEQGFETFEESDDFEDDDDDDAPQSIYQQMKEEVPSPKVKPKVSPKVKDGSVAEVKPEASNVLGTVSLQDLEAELVRRKGQGK